MSKTVVDVWVADLTFPGYMDRWRKLGEEFNAKHPDYHVNVEGKDFRLFPVDIANAAAAGRPPAVAEYYFYLVHQARDSIKPDGSPLFTSIEQAVAGRDEILGEPNVLPDLIAAGREYYSINGDLTAIPSVGTTSLLYANLDMLERAGVSQVPVTWDEVTAACEAVAGGPNAPEKPITWSNHGTFFQQAVASQGGLLANNDNGRSGRATQTDLSTKEMLSFVKWWQQLHADGHYLYTGKIPDWENTYKAFAEERVAIRISSSNDVNYMVAAAKTAGFPIGVGIFPFNSHVPYVGNAIAGTSLSVTAGLDKATEDGALAFLMFAHNPRNDANRHKFNSFWPVTHAGYNLLEEEGWFAEHPYHRVPSDHIMKFPATAIVDEAAAAAGVPPSTGAMMGDFAGNQDVMTNAMGDVLAKGADPDERFAEATVEAQSVLDAYYRNIEGTGPVTEETLRVEYFRDAEWYSGMDLENVQQLDYDGR
jgi:sn-glycerol 3-phosphate transport system substrate-binding protein